jgi:hypothetical protein
MCCHTPWPCSFGCCEANCSWNNHQTKHPLLAILAACACFMAAAPTYIHIILKNIYTNIHTIIAHCTDCLPVCLAWSDITTGGGAPGPAYNVLLRPCLHIIFAMYIEPLTWTLCLLP